MSNERIDLTQWKNEHREVYACCEAGEHYTDVLLAELKRMYKLEDEYRHLLNQLNQYCLGEGWMATCKVDGEGECRLEIETLDELMELVANETVEIPEYSHSSNELILYEEHCTCGVSHEEWMISTGRASE